jgi:predicted kinase
MPTLFVMSGLSFSGKTTLARRISEATGAPIVSYDELFATAERDPSVTGLDEWYLITDLVHDQARAHLEAGRSVIVDT